MGQIYVALDDIDSGRISSKKSVGDFSMLSERARNALGNRVKGRILFDEPLKNHTSLHIGGPAEVLIIPHDELDVKEIIGFAEEIGVQLTIIGNGTKLLVGDYGVDGITVKISGCLNNSEVSGTKVKAGAGYLLGQLSRLVANYELSGLEFATGIPGTVGGGVVMNAGAHECSLSDVVDRVTTIGFDGNIREFAKNECGFGYRQSRFQDDPSVVLTVAMTFLKDDVEEVQKRMRNYRQWRMANQPLDLPNAGSIFRNPSGLVAGKLIDEAGLKGMVIGGAQISQKRANFIVNLGNATASDVLELMQLMRRRVFEKYHVELEPEIRIVGRFR